MEENNLRKGSSERPFKENITSRRSKSIKQPLKKKLNIFQFSSYNLIN